MSDAYRRYRAIRQALMQCFSFQAHSHAERHSNTLTMMICGIIGSSQAQLPKIAECAPGFGSKIESQVMRYGRWLQNEDVSLKQWMLPVAAALLHSLKAEPLYLVMDGSTVGRGCMALMLSVVYHGRALPLAWVVVKADKGHLPQNLHRTLLKQVQTIMPADAQVVFLGDGEFDGTDLQADIVQTGWLYVCRTASNILVTAEGGQFAIADVPLAPGQAKWISPATITAERFGPLHVLLIWDQACKDPIYLLTNISDPQLAAALYHKRAHIETFFSDQKSRGFNIDRSHLSDPARLSRLLIASCLAYIWLIHLGVQAYHDDWRSRLHRRKRCDLSLFQLGRRLLNFCLRESLPIASGFLPPPSLPSSLFLSNECSVG